LLVASARQFLATGGTTRDGHGDDAGLAAADRQHRAGDLGFVDTRP
jgi:hypothetical protein